MLGLDDELPGIGESVDPIVIALDIEWPVSVSQYGGKRTSGKVATIQLALPMGHSYVFHLAQMGVFPGHW